MRKRRKNQSPNSKIIKLIPSEPPDTKRIVFEKYKQTYYESVLATSQLAITAAVSSHALTDFPARLPDDVRHDFMRLLDFFGEQVAKVTATVESLVAHSEEGKVVEVAKYEITNPTVDLLVFPFLSAVYSSILLGRATSPPLPQFDRILHQQQLVMIVAYLEAFVADTIMTICRIKPQTLSSRKPVEMDTVLSSGSWEQLLDRLARKFVFDMGWEAFGKSVEFLTRHLGDYLQVTPKRLSTIEDGLALRNIVIHNGGRVDENFLKRTGQTLKLGSYVPITQQYIEAFRSETQTLMGDIFAATSLRIFGQDVSLETAGWGTFHSGRHILWKRSR